MLAEVPCSISCRCCRGACATQLQGKYRPRLNFARARTRARARGLLQTTHIKERISNLLLFGDSPAPGVFHVDTLTGKRCRVTARVADWDVQATVLRVDDSRRGYWHNSKCRHREEEQEVRPSFPSGQRVTLPFDPLCTCAPVHLISPCAMDGQTQAHVAPRHASLGRQGANARLRASCQWCTATVGLPCHKDMY